MKIRKAKFPEKALKLIAIYKQKGSVELKKIKPKWAVGKKYQHATSLFKNSSKDYLIFRTSIKKLVEEIDFGEMGHSPVNPEVMFNGVNVRDIRVVTTLDHWNKGEYIDPPEVYVDRLGKLYFNNGRHRTVAAFNLKSHIIPIAIHSSQVEMVKKSLNLTGPIIAKK